MDGPAAGKANYIKNHAKYFQNKIKAAGRLKRHAAAPSHEAENRISDSIINNNS
jgi:hypothetical protein